MKWAAMLLSVTAVYVLVFVLAGDPDDMALGVIVAVMLGAATLAWWAERRGE